MSLLDSRIAQLDDLGSQSTSDDTSDPVTASSGFGVTAPTSTMVNSMSPGTTGTDLAGAPPAPAPAPAPEPAPAPTSLIDAATSKGAASPMPAVMATTNSMTPTSTGTDVAAAPAASASFTGQPLARTNAVAAAPAAYAGGTSYNDAIKFYNDNAAIANAPTYNGETTAGASWSPPQYSPNLQQAQSDFVGAITAGQDTGLSTSDIAGLGVGGGNEVYPQNDLMGSGAFKPSLVYGTTEYQDYAQGLGAALGLTSDQVAKAVGSVVGPAYQNSMNTGKAPFEIGNTPLAQQFTNAIYAAAGKTPDPTQQAKAQELDGYFNQLRQVKGHDHGIFGGGFGAFLALVATAGVGSAFLAPAVAAEAAGGAGAAAGAAGDVAAGEFGLEGLAGSGGISGLTPGGAAAAAGSTGATIAGMTPAEFEAAGGVTVTASSAPAAAGLTAEQLATGAAVAGGAAGAAQQLEGVQVTGHAEPAPAPGALPDLTPLSIAPLASLPSASVAQQANLDPDSSKWSMEDWAKYLKLASAVSGLLGSGGSASSSTAATPASTNTGSIQVPTTTPFGTPSTTSTSTSTAPSLIEQAKALQMPTTDYGGTTPINTGTTTAAAAPAAAGTTAGSAGFTAGKTVNANIGTVTADQTVSGQLDKLLAANGPLIDQARQRAIAVANSRGLQNSSIAGQGGEEAAISQALPIAQQDAATNLNQATRNQAAEDTAATLNENIRQSDNATGVQQNTLTESQREFDTTTSANAAKLAEDARQFNLDAAQKDRLAQLDTNTKSYLANVQAQYQTQMQTSSSAASLYKEFQDQVALISTSANMDAPNKQAAINLAASNLKNGMAVIGSISGLNLSDILQFA